MKIDRASLKPIDFEGLEIRDFTADLETSSSVAEIVVPAGAVHRRAWSKRSDKYYYVIRGEIQLVVDNQDLRICAGDCCVVRQGTKFSYRNATENEAVVVLVHTPSFDLTEEVFDDAL